ncbi:HK97 gp10 family phage protein [Rhodococcus gordoniae]|uniref:HK97 gp10 family phage protein n=1 Tax=Rhodococcus gordoniae TaxID=223392 RepID=UPI00352455EF
MSLNFNMAAIRAAAQRGLDDAAEVIKQEAIERTPKETGALRNDCTTHSGDLEAAVSYSLPYAVRQHEELGYRHEHGEAKFLENAVIATRQTVGQIIAQAIRRAM